MSANSPHTYTVKQVAKLSGSSVRALHFYDEIGLLKPAFYGENGYRYYEKEQLLQLQQFLFYRELGFELSIIQEIIGKPGFDRVAALRSHREHLLKETQRTHALIRTIDKTLALLENEEPMKDDEMYLGFDPKKQADYKQQIIDRWGKPAQKQIEESRRRTKSWKKEECERVKGAFKEIHRAFVQAITQGLAPSDDKVQKLTNRHYEIVDRFWTPNRESYVGLGKSYCDQPDFRKTFDAEHPRLAEYLASAMKQFAEKKLK